MSRTIPRDTEHLPKAAIFVAVIRHGSFAGAADALGMARSTVSQHIRSLEDALGARLLERTTRKISLTSEGTLLYEHMSAALGAWGEAREVFEGRASEPSGVLRVTSPSGLAQPLVAPVLASLAQDYPSLEIDLIADDRVRDLVADGIDVAVRMGSPGDENNVARRIGRDPRIIVAAPSLAATLDDRIETLEKVPWVGHHMFLREAVTLFEDGVPRTIRPRNRTRGSSTAAQLGLLAGGLGVAILPSLLVRGAIEAGQLVRVFEHLSGHESPIFALYPSRRLQPARARVFIDRLVASFG